MEWLVVIIGSTAGFLFGYDEGIISGSLDLVKQNFNLTTTNIGIMAAALPLGALFGSILVGSFLTYYNIKYSSRRFLLFFAGWMFFIGAIGAGLAGSVIILIISRLILGLAIGMASVIAPLYLSETASPRRRGAAVAGYQLALTIGIVSSYLVSFLLINYHAWRLMFISSALPALVLILGVLFLPESPRWLYSIGEYQLAAKTLKKLRKNSSITAELHDIKTTLIKKPKNENWLLLFKKPLLPVLILGITLFCLQQLSGINVIIYFAPGIFKNLGLDNITNQILATLGIGIINLVVTIIAILCIDRVGRRKLLLYGFIGTCFSLISLSIISFVQIFWLPYLAVIFLILYIFFFAISIGPVPHIAMAEIFPLHVRGAGMGLSAMSNWTFNTIVIFSFPLLQHNLGIELTFIIYAFICFIGIIYTYFFMPETKNISLEQIEIYVMSGKPLRFLGRKNIEQQDVRISHY